MSKPKSIGIYLFKHDLRLTDNPALLAISQQVDCLLCVYIEDCNDYLTTFLADGTLSANRAQFLQQSLQQLDQSLQTLGQQLVVLKGKTNVLMAKLIQQYQPNIIASNQHAGVYEQQQWQNLTSKFQQPTFIQTQGHSLFNQADLPFSLENLAPSFTPFRKKVETLTIQQPLPAPKALPPPAHVIKAEPLSVPSPQSRTFVGGESAGLAQLDYYLFEQHLIKTYKQTRNGLDGWDYSSKLSPWLANGNISARYVYAKIKSYEAQHGSNESTYWLYFELLWREYFYWYLLKHQHKLFTFAGVKGQAPNTQNSAKKFQQWCQGNTEYQLINAFMQQLNATGYMSNRGRQLVASCLVHELNLDWRYGAAYFEQQLIDFDVASNWGNWQYLAGVGADPRGHRKFDLSKQAEIYDPQSEFQNKWEKKVAK